MDEVATGELSTADSNASFVMTRFSWEPASAGRTSRATGAHEPKGNHKYAQTSVGGGGRRRDGFAPTFAAANGPYVGIEGGVTFPQSTDLDVILNNTSTTPVDYGRPTATAIIVDWKKPGWNVDAIAGYKFGLFKLEVEGGYQRAPIRANRRSSTC